MLRAPRSWRSSSPTRSSPPTGRRTSSSSSPTTWATATSAATATSRSERRTSTGWPPRGCGSPTSTSPRPVCSASRAALLTGCYPNRVGILGALGPASQHRHQRPTRRRSPQMLKPQGYATAIFGKWHLGHHPQFLPTRHGFDEYFGLPYSNDMWPKHPTAEVPRPAARSRARRSIETEPRPVAAHDAGTPSGPSRSSSKNKDQPFFLYVAAHRCRTCRCTSRDKFKGQVEARACTAT